MKMKHPQKKRIPQPAMGSKFTHFKSCQEAQTLIQHKIGNKGGSSGELVAGPFSSRFSCQPSPHNTFQWRRMLPTMD